MKLIKTVFFCLLILLNSCNGKNKDNSTKNIENKKMVEKFDIEIYKKTNYGFDNYTNKDGTLISLIDFDSLKGGVLKEIPPKPFFKTIYKEFYPNGNIKKKEIFIGERTKIDTSEYYDQDGNVEKVEENEKFGKVKPEDVLKFLESKKIINISNGKGRLNKDGRPTFEIQFDKNKKEYIIIIVEGKPNTEPWDNIGEPLAFLPLIYKIDGETGKVEELK
ncbi:hypothetical protein OMO38_19865 [Chryseobacterium sp. 09-1422]|uniref:Lipoprotein n=1 Tax=Chryseobacterium kimseyorum TaxID=2984028 RepID=A0ABT3I438_9FLAO|nr:hypothetical protein [Chryseobacterium kimseyorum]MCW3170793.1 hypothetical protein [Chryseobacterium kimseyorum]